MTLEILSWADCGLTEELAVKIMIRLRRRSMK